MVAGGLPSLFWTLEGFELELRLPDSAQADSRPLEILLHLARQQPHVTASVVSGVAFNLFTEVERHGQKFCRLLRAQVGKGQEDGAIGLIRVNCPADGLNERFVTRAAGFFSVVPEGGVLWGSRGTVL